MPSRETRPSADAVEGLLRLRQMVDDTPAVPHPAAINGMSGKNGTKGKRNGDMSLAALESLLVSRQAN